MKKAKEPEYVVIIAEFCKFGDDLNRFYDEGYELVTMNNSLAVLRKRHDVLSRRLDYAENNDKD